MRQSASSGYPKSVKNETQETRNKKKKQETRNKSIKNVTHSRVFLTKLNAFAEPMKHCLECLIYLLNQNKR